MRPGASSVGMPRSAGNKNPRPASRCSSAGSVSAGRNLPRRKSLCSGRPPSQALWRSACRTWPAASSAPAQRRQQGGARVQVGGAARQARIAEHGRAGGCCRHARRWRRAAARAARRCTSPPAGNARRSGAHPRLRCRHRRRPAPCRARGGDAAHAQLGAIAAGPVIPVHDQGFGLIGFRGRRARHDRARRRRRRDRRLAPLARPSPATPVIPPALPVPSAAPCPCDPLPCPAPPPVLPAPRRRHAPTRPAADSRVSVAIRYRCFHL